MGFSWFYDTVFRVTILQYSVGFVNLYHELIASDIAQLDYMLPGSQAARYEQVTPEFRHWLGYIRRHGSLRCQGIGDYW